MDRVTQLWVTVFGVSGRNGLNGTQREHASKIEKLQASLQEVDNLRSQVLTGVRVIQWMLLGAMTAIGFLMSGPAGEFVANVWRAGASK